MRSAVASCSCRWNHSAVVATCQYGSSVDDSSGNLTRGKALQRYIEARLGLAGLTSVVALATRAGVRPGTISEWWAKGKEPDLSTLRKVAGGLRVPVADLVSAYEGDSVDDVLGALVARAVRRELRPDLDRVQARLDLLAAPIAAQAADAQARQSDEGGRDRGGAGRGGGSRGRPPR